MCVACRDLDDYDSRHGHRCTDDCAASCDNCGISVCSDELRCIDAIDVCEHCAELMKECVYTVDSGVNPL